MDAVETPKTKTEQGRVPPYVAFETFKSFIESLRDTITPDTIDRGVMRGMSGAVQSHLMSTLRFLGLVAGKDDQSTGELKQLVNTFGRPDEWKAALESVLKSAYSTIVGDLDVATATDRRLRECFKDRGSVSGSMADRCVRFYVKSLKEAGVAVSPHITSRKQRVPGQRKAPNTAGKARQDGNGTVEEEQRKPNRNEADPPPPPPTGMLDFPIPLSPTAGFIRVPANVSATDMLIVNAIVNVVKVVADANTAKAEGAKPAQK